MSVFQNQWTYASALIENLAESEHFNGKLNARKREKLLKEVAKWSEVNMEVYGYYQLHQEQLTDILEGVELDSNQSASPIQTLIDRELITAEVTRGGEIVHKLSVVMGN